MEGWRQTAHSGGGEGSDAGAEDMVGGAAEQLWGGGVNQAGQAESRGCGAPPSQSLKTCSGGPESDKGWSKVAPPASASLKSHLDHEFFFYLGCCRSFPFP